MVWAVLFDGVNLAGDDQFNCLVPAYSFPTGLASCCLVFFRLLLIFNDAGIGLNGVFAFLNFFGIKIPQHLAYVGIFWSQGAVWIPRSGYPSLATPGFDIGDIRINLRIIRFLQFPANKPVFYEDFPTAGHRTVDAVGRSHAVVIVPSFSVKFLPRTGILTYAKPLADIFHDVPFGFCVFARLSYVHFLPSNYEPNPRQHNQQQDADDDGRHVLRRKPRFHNCLLFGALQI